MVWAIGGLVTLYVIVQVGRRFASSTGTLKERLVATARGSATVAILYFGAVLEGLLMLASDTEMRAKLEELLPMEYRSVLSVSLLVLAYMARQRTLGG